MPLPIPKFIKTAFANIGLRNNIPEITNNTTGAAGYDRGFGEINMLPEGAGGIPPDGKDFNGILFDLSAAIQYLQTGASFPFNQEFATAIGGYPKGSLISDVSNDFLWVCTVNNNTNPPSASGWEQVYFGDPTTTRRGLPFQASQVQAEAGENNTAMSTPLRVFQAIRSSFANANETLRGVLRVSTQLEVESGSLDSTAVTPKKLKAGFLFQSSSNGYFIFPKWMGGLIIQWGTAFTNPAGIASVTFPVAFPNTLFSFVPSVDGTITSSLESCQFANLSNTSAQIFAGIPPSTPVVNAACKWIAIGY